MDFNTLNAKLGTRNRLKIANNTWLIRHYDGEAISVRLHSTDIVTYLRDGGIGLHSGGYRTVTTKRRMNDWTPSNISIYQKDYEWFVVVDRKFDSPFPFDDGMDVAALINASERMDSIEREARVRMGL